MAKKISQLAEETSPALGDSVPFYDASAAGTRRSLFSSLVTLFFNNIPAGSASPITRSDETQFDYVASGGVWTADAAGSTRNASMTAATVYINGFRIAIGAVTARTFTASKDTYVDVLSAEDGTGSLVYTEATLNAASSALAANSVRIAIIVTGASSIANAGSINQGEEAKVLPIASSIPYAVTDSLGNLICPRDPERKLLGHRLSTTNTGTFTAETDITGLSCPVIVPTGRKIKITGLLLLQSSVNDSTCAWKIKESSTLLIDGRTMHPFANVPVSYEFSHQPSGVSAGAHTYKIAVARSTGTGNITNVADSTSLFSFIRVELE